LGQKIRSKSNSEKTKVREKNKVKTESENIVMQSFTLELLCGLCAFFAAFAVKTGSEAPCS
jgi:hypothetical protein